jgi:hypothetical protein
MYENYFTISNSSNDWVQSHLRFRGSAWSAELLDFDIILSPGDVFVFRLADIDGDGAWEVDGRLDPKNFQYTGMVFTCTGPTGSFTPCVDGNNMLEPDATGIDNLKKAGFANAEQIVGLQRQWGYVEFIGEAILQGMTQDIMKVLVGDAPGTWAGYVTSNGNKKGTNTWRWADAEGGRFQPCPSADRCDRGLGDVPNVLSGTAFITVPGQSSGLAYNAEALRDFRTTSFPHRIDNYNRKANTGVTAGLGSPNNAVILHHESASSPVNGPAPVGDYVYGASLDGEDRDDEAVISFNNTWGPTLADGDDYFPTDISNPANHVPGVIPGLPIPASATANSVGVSGNVTGNDAWDEFRRTYGIGGTVGTLGVHYNGLPYNNSITEVEMAVRRSGLSQRGVFDGADPGLQTEGQIFTSFYFDGDSFDKSGNSSTTLSSYYLGFFPTKFFYGENLALAKGQAVQTYINNTVLTLLKLAKPVTLEVWDINEVPCTCTRADISPSRTSSCKQAMGYELNIWDIKWSKQSFTDGNCQNYKNGRTVVQLDTLSGQTVNVPPGVRVSFPGDNVARLDGYPGLLYTFEMSSDPSRTFTHWRSLSKR